MSDVDDLVTWLRAQLDDDERAAPSVHALDCELTMTAGFSGPCTCGWADRLLAEVDAKRRIVNFFEYERIDVSRSGGPPETLPGRRPVTADPVLRLLALPYAGRPGYREEWKP